MANLVKPATFTDIEGLVDLMAEFYEESGYRLNSELSRQAFGELIEDPTLGQVWLLQHNSQVAGYIVLTVGFSMEYGGRDAFVDDLFVRSKFRRLGLGRCGLEVLLAECHRRSVQAVHLEVGRSNEPAKKLYAKFGFQDNNRQLLTVRLKEETTAL
jgi:ribosomal protein S18 acetylase RimI-like enzyme